MTPGYYPQNNFVNNNTSNSNSKNKSAKTKVREGSHKKSGPTKFKVVYARKPKTDMKVSEK